MVENPDFQAASPDRQSRNFALKKEGENSSGLISHKFQQENQAQRAEYPQDKGNQQQQHFFGTYRPGRRRRLLMDNQDVGTTFYQLTIPDDNVLLHCHGLGLLQLYLQ